MPLTLQVLIALLGGLAVGLGLPYVNAAVGNSALAVLGPVGTIFINSIRMTVVPLVAATLIVGVGSAQNPRAVGRMGLRSLVIFFVVLSAAAAAGVLLGAPLMNAFPLDEAAVTTLRASANSAAAAAPSIPTLGEWLTALVPVNPLKAAVDGAMLQIIVVSVAFAAAITQIAEERRTAVLRVFEGIQDASLVLVRFILRFAPIGVFALAVPLAFKMGVSAAGALLGYIAIVSAICVAFMAFILYPAAVLIGRVPLKRFAPAALPAQGIAFSSRSSLAALPAMLEAVRGPLALPPAVASFFIPLAASMFRAGAGIGQTVGVIFIAKLYGVDLGTAQYVTIAVTSVVTSFSVPGVPGGSILVMVPVLMAAGIPVEGIGILLGVDTIPDMFRTTTNVTGHLTAAVIVARDEAPTPA
jgi:proton glutamate symport protein